MKQTYSESLRTVGGVTEITSPCVRCSPARHQEL